MKRRVLSLLMTLCMVFALLPVSAQAAKAPEGYYYASDAEYLQRLLEELGDTPPEGTVITVTADTFVVDRNITTPETVRINVQGDMVVNDGVIFENGGELEVRGDLTVNTGAKLTANGNIYVDGNVTVKGTLTVNDFARMYTLSVATGGLAINSGTLLLPATVFEGRSDVSVARNGRFVCEGILRWNYETWDCDELLTAIEDMKFRRLEHPDWLQNAEAMFFGEITIDRDMTVPAFMTLQFYELMTIAKNRTLTTNGMTILANDAVINGTWINNDHIWMDQMETDVSLTKAAGGSYSGGSIQVNVPMWGEEEYTNLPWDLLPGFTKSDFEEVIEEEACWYLLGEEDSGLTFTTQPKNVIAKVGDTVTFTAVPEDTEAHLAYQWEYKTANGKSWQKATATGNKSGTLSVKVTAAKNGYQYRCVVTDGYTCSNSKSATLTVSGAVVAPTITTQPKSQTVNAGGKVSFSVTATGTDLKYQWQYRASSTGTWKNNSCTTATFTLADVSSGGLNRNGYQYRCKVTNSAGTVTSNAATLTVKAVAKPVITTQPKSQTVAAGGTATFTVAATGEGLTYQWRYRTANGTTWYNATATGNKTATLKVPVTASKDGYVYCCRVTNAAGTTVSQWATLTVKKEAAKPVITTQPTDVTVAPTAKATFTVAATGATSYQWQYRTSSTGTWANAGGTGNKTATMTFNPAAASRDGYQYRCKITNASGTVYSNVVTLYIKPAITAQPQSVEAKAGTTAKFTVTANGKDVTYQWQYRTSSSGSWAKATATGNKTATLSVPATAGRNGYQYRCVVTGKSGKITYSNAATLTVK